VHSVTSTAGENEPAPECCFRSAQLPAFAFCMLAHPLDVCVPVRGLARTLSHGKIAGRAGRPGGRRHLRQVHREPGRDGTERHALGLEAGRLYVIEDARHLERVVRNIPPLRVNGSEDDIGGPQPPVSGMFYLDRSDAIVSSVAMASASGET